MNNNDKISLWMGRPCSCEYGTEINEGIETPTRYWGNCAMHGLGGLSIPWETSDRRAVELLPILDDKKYGFTLFNSRAGTYALEIFCREKLPKPISAESRTLAGAITSAVLKLLESI